MWGEHIKKIEGKLYEEVFNKIVNKSLYWTAKF